MSPEAPLSPRISCGLAVGAAAALSAVEILARPIVDLGVLYLAIVLTAGRVGHARLVAVTASVASAFALVGPSTLPEPSSAVAHRLVVVGVAWALLVFQRAGRRGGLLEGEQTFRALLEAAPDAMVIVDEAGRIVLVNTQAEKLFGYERRELLGEPVERLIPADLRERHRAHRGAYGAEPRPRTMGVGLELAALRKDGSSFPVEIALGPLSGERGVLVSAAIRDITDRKRIERAQRDFLATLGHELRNPMAAISNAARLLRHDAVTPEQLHWSQQAIEAEGRHMTRLIDDLLDLSRVDRNTIELRRERVDFARIVDRVLDSCRPILDQRGHEFSVSLPPQALHLDADPVRLVQVLNNLVDNAAKYTPPGGRIVLDACRDGGWLAVRVRDNGHGVAAESLGRLFDMFYRADRSLEQQEGGLGIGLTLVKQLVELHGGTVEASSDGKGHGSEFTVRLPALPDVPASGSPITQAAAASGASRRILVVDDNRRAADSLALLLRLEGHAVETAYDGAEAVGATERFGPDVVLLDIGLPRLNGFEAARRMREKSGSRPILVVALTGLGTPEDRERAARAGFDTLLVKPVDVDALIRLLSAPVPHGAAQR